MGYLIFILVTFLLLVCFFVLSDFETKRGIRLFASRRTRLDENVEQIEFILKNVDILAFLKEEMLRVMHLIANTIAQLSLLAVRATERFLTRLVRYLRTRRAIDTVPRENAREFVRTLSDFKGHLETTRPEVPDVY
ncbi:MAG: hypothetical protein V1711_01475 [bacterium]